MQAVLFIPWFRLEAWDIPLPFSLPIVGDTLSIQPFGVLVATGVLLGVLGVSSVGGPLARFERYGHALAGFVILACGAAMTLGL